MDPSNEIMKETIGLIILPEDDPKIIRDYDRLDNAFDKAMDKKEKAKLELDLASGKEYIWSCLCFALSDIKKGNGTLKGYQEIYLDRLNKAKNSIDRIIYSEAIAFMEELIYRNDHDLP